MPDAWNSVKVRDFEHVPATPTVTLLRVSGKPPRRRTADGPRPVLVANDGEMIRRFAAIPSPPDERGVVRAAYSVNSDLLAPSTTFSLELTDGSLVALPAPQPGVSRLVPGPGPETSDAPESPQASDERRSGLVAKLTELSARLAESEQARDELQQSVGSIGAASERLEHELLGARERAARAETEARQSASALEELETWRGELERRLTETVDELSDAKVQITTLTDQLAQADHRQAAPPPDVGLAAVPFSPSERASIARQAGQLAALLGGAERLTELAGELALARTQAENLYAAASVESAPPGGSPGAPEDALSIALAEIEDLRAELAQAREREKQARVETVRVAAEAEARELAERELAEAASAEL